MQDFVGIILGFPTILYTLLLGVVALYWLMTVAGVVGVDALDFDLDLDAADGAIDGLDADIGDMEIDGDLDDQGAALEGGRQLAEGGQGPGFLVTVLSMLGVRGVPLTISLSVFVLLNWSLTAMGIWALGSPGWLLRALVFLGALVVSWALTKVALRPLGKVFQSDERSSLSRQGLIGQVCRVRTGSVDDGFGQGILVARGGAEMLLEIRCDEVNGLEKGQEALIIGFDEGRRAYLVEEMDSLEERLERLKRG